MNCEQATEFLAEYWDSVLDEIPRRELEAHLAVCPSCRAEATRLKAFWMRLGAIPDEAPNAAGRGRFEALLADYQRATRASRWDAFLENWWPKRPAAQIACAMATLVVGLLAGHALTVDVQRGTEVARLQEEVSSTRQLVALSMLRQQSASERLKGVDWSYQIPRPEPQVVNALLETVNYDDTVDVRLAAVDALRRLSREGTVRSKMAQALDRQDSPLVQIALIDALADSHSPEVRTAILRVAELPTINPAVRSHAQAVIERMGGRVQ
jgi:Putative zinc-finger